LATLTRLFLAAALTAPLLCATPAPAQEDIVTPINDLEDLARVIGGAHQLRQLCDGTDQVWRDQMLALIAIEAKDDDRRERQLIDAFNAGFRAQQQQRLRCNADARQAEAQLAAEGRRLAEDLRDRYLH
jgi:uncharacterized protein (TIGR02301 family)